MTNKKRLSMAVGIGALSLFMAVVLWAAKGHEHKSSEECCPGKGQGKHMMCPMKIDGAEVKVVNTDNGVTIHITAEDSKVVKEIQTATANMVKKGCCPKHLGKTHKREIQERGCLHLSHGGGMLQRTQDKRRTLPQLWNEIEKGRASGARVSSLKSIEPSCRCVEPKHTCPEKNKRNPPLMVK